ncbi:hypothetical protein Q0F98_37680 [Paenibacillus amylolyticus]|nr:hypothetical protein Q0F98_37680 [Paenibacillus amylolyticus]
MWPKTGICRTGLQAALVAKEGLQWKAGGRILGTITIQHFISLYSGNLWNDCYSARFSNGIQKISMRCRLCGIALNQPNIRIDHKHRIYTHKEAKYKSLVQEISSVHREGRPILIGTSSVEESDMLAEALAVAGVPCQVLNAKTMQKKPKSSKAGEIGAVTVSTNMAGRASTFVSVVATRAGRSHCQAWRIIRDRYICERKHAD